MDPADAEDRKRRREVAPVLAGGRDAPAVEEMKRYTQLALLGRATEALERIAESLEIISAEGEKRVIERPKPRPRGSNSRTTNATTLRKRSAKARRSRNADDE
jgi:hypothetical protein